MGIKVAMITGDNANSALKVATFLSIPHNYVFSNKNPGQKKRVVLSFQQEDETVMFVGDGVNDSPVLAQADIGVALGSTADITLNAASIVCMKDCLDDVLNAILISRATQRRIIFNFCWAFLYNLVLVPIAMGCLYPLGVVMDPMLAGMAMGLSSVSVVTSSLFLKCYRYRRL